jgi:hypothetical protein
MKPQRAASDSEFPGLQRRGLLCRCAVSVQRIVDNTLFLSRPDFRSSGAKTSWHEWSRSHRWQPYSWTSTVYGAAFTLYCERHGVRLPALRFVICSYEFVA